MKREHHSETNVFEGRTLDVLDLHCLAVISRAGTSAYPIMSSFVRVARHRPVLSRFGLKYVLMTWGALVKRRSGKSRPRHKIRYI